MHTKERIQQDKMEASSVFLESTKEPKLDPAKLDVLWLENGAHDDRNQGLCAMEAVAWLAGEEHSDVPECASRVLAMFVQKVNDKSLDEERQALKPYLLRLINTAGEQPTEQARLYAGTNALLEGFADLVPGLKSWLPVSSPQSIRNLMYFLDCETNDQLIPVITYLQFFCDPYSYSTKDNTYYEVSRLAEKLGYCVADRFYNRPWTLRFKVLEAMLSLGSRP